MDLLACGLGAAIGISLYLAKISLSGVPTIESFVSSGALYWSLGAGPHSLLAQPPVGSSELWSPQRVKIGPPLPKTRFCYPSQSRRPQLRCGSLKRGVRGAAGRPPESISGVYQQ